MIILVTMMIVQWLGMFLLLSWNPNVLGVVKYGVNFRFNMTIFPNDDIPMDVEEIYVDNTSISTVDYLKPFPRLVKLLMNTNLLIRLPDVTNVTSTLKELSVKNSKIKSVDYLLKMPVLEVLRIVYSRLTTFPDLRNISGTLRELYLYGNYITAVELPPMAALRILLLKTNALTGFPDLANASATLEILDLRGNDVHSVPDALLRPLMALFIFGLGTIGGGPIKLPNPCYLGRYVEFELWLDTDQVTCDRSAVYAKLAEVSGKLLMKPQNGPIRCTSPEMLAGKLYANITTEDLLYQHGESITY